jgi:hypothetical protein
VTDHDQLLARAEADAAALEWEPPAWWDDEHCLDNGHAAVSIRRLAAALRAVTAECDALRTELRNKKADDEGLIKIRVNKYVPPGQIYVVNNDAMVDAFRRAAAEAGAVAHATDNHTRPEVSDADDPNPPAPAPTYDYPHHGTCDACAEGPKDLREPDPETQAWICRDCSDRIDAAIALAAEVMGVPITVAAAGIAAYEKAS